MALYRARKAYKSRCATHCLIIPRQAFIGADRLSAYITFRIPDARRRDMDNMLAAIKAGIDAASDHVGVDDSRWTLTLAIGQPIKGGAVVIELEPIK
ncbi:MAG: endodeoxyribonuclease RusA [Candidatus Limnocylindrus sp.]